ncbi:hypothetical protein [Nonomuraea longicatena]|uniref:Uncharacterized protein n=1 Tax=Nonomuraea longicatena TaxID=83682 RepID=A0ABP3ZAQ8_9ACTN
MSTPSTATTPTMLYTRTNPNRPDRIEILDLTPDWDDLIVWAVHFNGDTAPADFYQDLPEVDQLVEEGELWAGELERATTPAGLRAYLAGMYNSLTETSHEFYGGGWVLINGDPPGRIVFLTESGPMREGGTSVFRVLYTDDGRILGGGFASGDELDKWEKDLTEDGWAVEIIRAEDAR